MKKLLSVLITFALLLTMIPAAVFADEPVTASKFATVKFGDTVITNNTRNTDVVGDGKINSITISNIVNTTFHRSNQLFVTGSITYEKENKATASSQVVDITNSVVGSGESKNFSLTGADGITCYGHYIVDLSVWESGEDSDPRIYSFYAEFDYAPAGTEAKLTYYDETTSANVVIYDTMANLITSANTNGGEIVLFDDVANPGSNAIEAGIIVDANGHQIGASSTPLQVGDFVDFYNLAGTFYVKAMSYDGTLISVHKPEAGSVLNHIELSLGAEPQTFCYGSILYFWGYDDDEVTPVYPSVSLNAPGYFALQGQYGSITIAKTIDYPYAVLNGSGVAADPYHFDFYSTLSDAFAAAGDSDPVYVMNYLMLNENKTKQYEINTYNLAGPLTEDQVSRLKTMFRVTDGSKSDFYTYVNHNWNFLYSNAGAKAFDLNLYFLFTTRKATINAIGGIAKTDAHSGEVNVTTNQWPVLETATVTIPEDNYSGSTSYIIPSGSKLTDVITFDASGYTGTTPIAITLVSQKKDVNLSITGNVDDKGKSNVTFNILGDYKNITIDDAEVKLGENLDYKVTEGIATNVGYLDTSGHSFVTVGSGANNYVASIGCATLIDSTEASFENVLFAPTDKVGYAVGIESDSYALIYNSDIKMTGANKDKDEDYVCGIVNHGMLGLMETGIEINDSNPNDYVYGIWNRESATMILDNASRDINLNKGIGIASERYAKTLTSTIDSANIYVGGANPDGDAIGIYQNGGQLLLRPGYGMYDDTTSESINITVADDNGYGILIDGASFDNAAQWTITGPKDSVTVNAANAIYADSTESYAPNFSSYNITVGKYVGNINISGASGAAGLKIVMPSHNYYAEPISGGYRVLNEEYELRKYLTSEAIYPSSYQLHTNVYFGWGDDYSLPTTFNNCYGTIEVAGNKSLDVNGYNITSYGREYYDGLFSIPEGASLALYATSAGHGGSIRGNMISLHNNNVVVSVDGGSFTNGSLYDSSKHGVNIQSDDQYVEETSDGTIALVQSAGSVNLYDGSVSGMVVRGGGNMNIYGGKYFGVTDLYLGQDQGSLNIYGGTFCPAQSFVNDTTNVVFALLNWTQLFEDDKENRTIRPTEGSSSSMIAKGVTFNYDGGTLSEYTNESKTIHTLRLIPNSPYSYAHVEITGYVPPAPSGGGGGSAPKKEEVTNAFVDVNESDYFFDPVLWAVEKEITKGTDATHFSPNAEITRGQVVTFLWRAAGCPVVNYYMNLDDVDQDAYYSEAVRWALAEGITMGTDAKHFSPNEVCTRGQVVTFIWRAVCGLYVDYFMQMDDVADGAYYTPAVRWALAEGITKGTDATHFSPAAGCTRGQVVTFLYRYFSNENVGSNGSKGVHSSTSSNVVNNTNVVDSIQLSDINIRPDLE